MSKPSIAGHNGDLAQSTESRERLKPCPFCGAANDAIMRATAGGFVRVECKACACGTGYYPDEKRAVLFWNRRACPECEKKGGE